MPLILLLVLLVLFSPLAIDIYLPAIPQMAEQLGAEVTLMQGTITWFLFSMGLGQLLVGPLGRSLRAQTHCPGGRAALRPERPGSRLCRQPGRADAGAGAARLRGLRHLGGRLLGGP